MSEKGSSHKHDLMDSGTAYGNYGSVELIYSAGNLGEFEGLKSQREVSADFKFAQPTSSSRRCEWD